MIKFHELNYCCLYNLSECVKFSVYIRTQVFNQNSGPVLALWKNRIRPNYKDPELWIMRWYFANLFYMLRIRICVFIPLEGVYHDLDPEDVNLLTSFKSKSYYLFKI